MLQAAGWVVDYRYSSRRFEDWYGATTTTLLILLHDEEEGHP